MPSKFWEIKNSIGAESIGELLIYGDLANVSWWGDDVTPKQFNKDLDALGAVDELHIRFNSYGGDVFAGHSIYNSIKNFKRKYHCEVKGFVDGIAASAASVVLQAADKRIVPVNGIVMVHDPMLGLCGYFNETELKQYLEALGPIKDSIVAAYHEKTGIPKDEIAKTMKDETWMTAEKAIELGYADVIDDSIDVTLELDAENKVIINNVEFDSKHFKNAPSGFMNWARPLNPQVANVAQNNSVQTKEEEILNISDLKNKYPDIYKEVYNQGVTDERSRIKSIEDLARPGDEKLLNSAKFEKPIDSGMFAQTLIAADNAVRETVVKNMEEDAENIGEITPPADDAQTESEEMQKDIQDMVNMMNKVV